MALACLNALGWVGLLAIFLTQMRTIAAIKETIDRTGFETSESDLAEIVEQYTQESSRYHRAAYAFRLDSSTRGAELSQNLQRIVQLAFQELPAASVELSLYEEESGMWTQSLMIGLPTSFESQTALAAEEEKRTKFTKEYNLSSQAAVIAKPVTFARSTFGTLRVELLSGVECSESDRQVLNLLAAQGALMLVDARFTDEVIRMRRAGEESTRAKTGFLANLSHEIRGPLGIILSGVEISLEGLCGAIPEEQKEMLRMIQSSGNHLLDLVNDVLDYARVESGKISATPIDLALSPLLDDLTAVVRTQAEAKNHTLTLEEVAPELGISCDKRHARQILINFLTNAIKYTPEGGKITVTVSRPSVDSIKISVKDTGIGIPPEEQYKVFSAFERVDHEYANTQVGTGLGMPLTKRLAAINGGSVGFESEDGEGSIFWVTLPFAAVEHGKHEILAEDESLIAQGEGECILFVDTKDEMSELVERYLLKHNFEVVRASKPIELIQCLRTHPIRIVLVENDIAGFSGEEIISSIRATPGFGSVPIILLSSRAFVFDIARYLQLGVDRCLSKPVALREITANIRRLIDESKVLESHSSSEPAREVTAD
jgi:signal transduction histidine kinase/ActR/RegA family two-component response regulator